MSGREPARLMVVDGGRLKSMTSGPAVPAAQVCSAGGAGVALSVPPWRVHPVLNGSPGSLTVMVLALARLGTSNSAAVDPSSASGRAARLPYLMRFPSP